MSIIFLSHYNVSHSIIIKLYLLFLHIFLCFVLSFVYNHQYFLAGSHKYHIIIPIMIHPMVSIYCFYFEEYFYATEVICFIDHLFPTIMLELLFLLIIKLRGLDIQLQTTYNVSLSEISHDLSIKIILNEVSYVNYDCIFVSSILLSYESSSLSYSLHSMFNYLKEYTIYPYIAIIIKSVKRIFPTIILAYFSFILLSYEC